MWLICIILLVIIKFVNVVMVFLEIMVLCMVFGKLLLMVVIERMWKKKLVLGKEIVKCDNKKMLINK